jgi:ABC-type glycerol-3-phosphate transport system permease component
VRTRHGRGRRALVYLGAAAVAVYSGFPVYWMLVSAFRHHRHLFATPTLWPGPFTLESFANLLRVTDFPRYFANSVLVASATTAVTLAVSALMAYAVARYRSRWSRLVVHTMLYAYMLPPLLLAIPLFVIFSRLGLADTMLSLVISHLTLTLPLGVWLLWGFFKTFPVELEEAALVDGASVVAMLWRITLPLSLPGMATAGIFAFLLSWTDYTYALMMVSADARKTIPIGLAAMMGDYDLRWGEMMAGSVLVSVPLLVILAGLSRWFVGGLTVGAVKG